KLTKKIDKLFCGYYDNRSFGEYSGKDWANIPNCLAKLPNNSAGSPRLPAKGCLKVPQRTRCL
ncbi:MAG: hypothetical protein LBU34_17500, partial [Planctomycetaceae bacterium]|nr:hypothetical protein [Planctomycetaceae bacterium]